MATAIEQKQNSAGSLTAASTGDLPSEATICVAPGCTKVPGSSSNIIAGRCLGCSEDCKFCSNTCKEACCGSHVLCLAQHLSQLSKSNSSRTKPATRQMLVKLMNLQLNDQSLNPTLEAITSLLQVDGGMNDRIAQQWLESGIVEALSIFLERAIRLIKLGGQEQRRSSDDAEQNDQAAAQRPPAAGQQQQAQAPAVVSLEPVGKAMAQLGLYLKGFHVIKRLLDMQAPKRWFSAAGTNPAACAQAVLTITAATQSCMASPDKAAALNASHICCEQVASVLNAASFKSTLQGLLMQELKACLSGHPFGVLLLLLKAMARAEGGLAALGRAGRRAAQAQGDADAAAQARLASAARRAAGSAAPRRGLSNFTLCSAVVLSDASFGQEVRLLLGERAFGDEGLLSALWCVEEALRGCAGQGPAAAKFCSSDMALSLLRAVSHPRMVAQAGAVGEKGATCLMAYIEVMEDLVGQAALQEQLTAGGHIATVLEAAADTRLALYQDQLIVIAQQLAQGIPTIPEKDRKLLVASPTACAGLLKRVAAAVDQPDVLAKGNLPVEAAMQLLLRFFHRSLSLKDLKQARLHELVTALPVSVSIKQAKKLAKARRQRPAGAAGAGAGVQQPHPLIGYLAQQPELAPQAQDAKLQLAHNVALDLLAGYLTSPQCKAGGGAEVLELLKMMEPGLSSQLQGCLQLLQLPPAQRSGQLEAANTLAGLLLYVLLLMVTVAGSEQQAVVLHMAESGLMAAAVDWLVAAGMTPALEACQARALQLLPLATNWCCYAMDQQQQQARQASTSITINASNISFDHSTGTLTLTRPAEGWQSPAGQVAAAMAQGTLPTAQVTLTTSPVPEAAARAMAAAARQLMDRCSKPEVLALLAQVLPAPGAARRPLANVAGSMLVLSDLLAYQGPDSSLLWEKRYWHQVDLTLAAGSSSECWKAGLCAVGAMVDMCVINKPCSPRAARRIKVLLERYVAVVGAIKSQGLVALTRAGVRGFELKDVKELAAAAERVDREEEQREREARQEARREEEAQAAALEAAAARVRAEEAERVRAEAEAEVRAEEEARAAAEAAALAKAQAKAQAKAEAARAAAEKKAEAAQVKAAAQAATKQAAAKQAATAAAVAAAKEAAAAAQQAAQAASERPAVKAAAAAAPVAERKAVPAAQPRQDAAAAAEGSAGPTVQRSGSGKKARSAAAQPEAPAAADPSPASPAVSTQPAADPSSPSSSTTTSSGGSSPVAAASIASSSSSAAAAARPRAARSGSMRAAGAPQVCAACGATEGKLRLCVGCSAVRYCGRDCQKGHWKDHRAACQAVQAAVAAAQAQAMQAVGQ